MNIHHPLSFPSGRTQQDDANVTVLIDCRLPAAEKEPFLSGLREVLAEFDAFPGTLGSDVFELPEEDGVRITVVQRYASAAGHTAWLASPAFTRWKEGVGAGRVEAVRRYSGMEMLFAQAQGQPSPPQWKMAVVLSLAAFPGSYVLSKWFGQMLAGLPPLVGALITTPIMVIAMTYLMVPLLTRFFASWLAQGRSGNSSRA